MAAIVLIAVGLGFVIRDLDVGQLRGALASATLWPVALAAVLSFVGLWGKAGAWRILLAPRARVSTRRLFRYGIVSAAGSVIAPGRAGEILRVWLLKRRDGVKPADTIAVAVAERLLDAAAMLALVAPLPWLLPGLPAWIGRASLLCAGIALTVFVALSIAVMKRAPTAPSSWLRQFIDGIQVLRSPALLLAAFGALLLVWVIDLGEVMLCLAAVGISMQWAGALLVLFTLNLVIAVPSTPGQVGALELGALIGTDLLHIPRAPALAFALLYHAMQIVPLILVGLALELPLVLGRDPDSTALTGPTP